MTKAQYEEIAQIYRDTIDNLKETITTLRVDKDILQTQVFRLQDGLMAVRAPEAYRDYRMDSIGAEPAPEDLEADKKCRAYAQATRDHLDSIEKPLFESADDMIDILSPILVTEAGKSEPLHRNTES